MERSMSLLGFHVPIKILKKEKETPKLLTVGSIEELICLLYITDIISGISFLVDNGTRISLILSNATDKIRSKGKMCFK